MLYLENNRMIGLVLITLQKCKLQKKKFSYTNTLSHDIETLNLYHFYYLKVGTKGIIW